MKTILTTITMGDYAVRVTMIGLDGNEYGMEYILRAEDDVVSAVSMCFARVLPDALGESK